MRKSMKFLSAILAALTLTCAITPLSALAETTVFSANFISVLTSTRGTFSSYSQNNTGNANNMTVSISDSEYAYFPNNMSISPVNGAKPAGKYAYNRQAVFTSSGAFSSEFGLSMKLRLKLQMSPLESLNTADGFGRTGFVVNIRDYLLRNTDNEFYFCIAEYNNQLVVSSVGGDRNHLTEQPVEYVILSNANPDVFHTYLFVYDPLSGIKLYVDDEYCHLFSLDSVGERSVTTGYYYNDFVSLSLINRSMNASLNAAGTHYVANSSAYLDYIKVYNGQRKQYNLIGIKEVDDPAGHDHVSGIEAVQKSLIQMGVSSSEINLMGNVCLSPESFMNKMEGSSVLVYRGHGSSSEENGTFVLSQPEETEDEKRFVTSEAIKADPLDLSDTDLILFVGCKTGQNVTTPSNLPDISVGCGAKSALGFKFSIYCNDSNVFVDRLFNYLRKGISLREAVDLALCADDEKLFASKYSSITIKHYHLAGDESLTLC